jgi:hypothetical protein
MVADINLQAWMETNAAMHPPMVTPYLRSAESQHIHYKLQVIKMGRGGTSNVGQSGSVSAQAGAPTALSQFSISVGPQDKCRIELTLTPDGAASIRYHFDCPR